MSAWGRRLVLAAALVASLPGASATRRGRAPSNEPFRSFQAMDRQLSLLNARVGELSAKRLDATARTRAARDIGVASGRIEILSKSLAARYRARRQGFGVRKFTILNKKAGLVGRSARALTGAKDDAAVQRALEQLSRTTLELVMEFQKVSANYGAVHCQRGAWACCEPKREPERNAGAANACKWTCVAGRRRCRGFLGPQTRSP